VLKTLIGTGPAQEGRRWNKKISLALHLMGSMHSMSSYWKRKFVEREAYLEAEILEMPRREGRDVSPLDNVVSDKATIEESLIEKEREDRIFQLFKHDFEATAVFQGFADGLRKNEITQKHGFNEAQYQAALRRIRVKLSIGRNGRNGGETMAGKKIHDERFERIMNRLAESVLEVSDEAILGEINETVPDAHEQAEHVRSTLQRKLQTLDIVQRQLSNLGHTIDPKLWWSDEQAFYNNCLDCGSLVSLTIANNEMYGSAFNEPCAESGRHAIRKLYGNR
jgi:hypothetical protein